MCRAGKDGGAVKKKDKEMEFADRLDQLLTQYTVGEIHWTLNEALKRCKAMETVFGYAEAGEMRYQPKPKTAQTITDEVQ